MAQEKEVELEFYEKELERSKEIPKLITIDVSILEQKDRQITSFKSKYEFCQKQVLEEIKKRQNITLYFKKRISLLNSRIEKLKAINCSLMEEKERKVGFFKSKYELCKTQIFQENNTRQKIISNFSNRISLLNKRIEKLKAINCSLIEEKERKVGFFKSKYELCKKQVFEENCKRKQIITNFTNRIRILNNRAEKLNKINRNMLKEEDKHSLCLLD